MSFAIPSGRLDDTILVNLKRLGLSPEYLSSIRASRQKYDCAVLDAKMRAEGFSVSEKIAIRNHLARAGVI